MGPNGKQHAERLLADVDGIVLTPIATGDDVAFIDIAASCLPSEALNALDDDGHGMMHHNGDPVLPGTPALVIRGIGEYLLPGVSPEDAQVLITLEDLAVTRSKQLP